MLFCADFKGEHKLFNKVLALALSLVLLVGVIAISPADTAAATTAPDNTVFYYLQNINGGV